MNPSAAGWIPKFLNLLDKVIIEEANLPASVFYLKLKKTGFIYGNTTETLSELSKNSLQLTKEEITKINLLHSLLYIYYSHNPTESSTQALRKIYEFYKSLDRDKKGFFSKLSFSKSESQNLEKIIAARLQESNGILKANNSALLTYAFLFVDVLAFSKWLETPQGIKEYVSNFESVAIHLCFKALKAKEKKKKYDLLLIELFEASTEYASENLTIMSNVFSSENLSEKSTEEKNYLLDLCCIAVWDDYEMDIQEFEYLQNLTQELSLPETSLYEAILDIKTFTEASAKKIKLFTHTNPVKRFYKQSVATVKLLILRNKNRLIQELLESGELVKLLSLSTVQDLSEEEKKKVKEQLLDICKTIPSLTIFLLPGGTVLLPLLVKFIPKLLPSAFDENRIEK
ncbi:LETM1-related biofilm-associated protein [Jejudonia soesokkakensis]|uniref:LETM1-related biofilm-associated protein n=1 Tax=Jejudonia soesokkakensis TaxID=1323432 RepID=A0ABW2MU18_9FLAO